MNNPAPGCCKVFWLGISPYYLSEESTDSKRKSRLARHLACVAHPKSTIWEARTCKSCSWQSVSRPVTNSAVWILVNCNLHIPAGLETMSTAPRSFRHNICMCQHRVYSIKWTDISNTVQNSLFQTCPQQIATLLAHTSTPSLSLTALSLAWGHLQCHLLSVRIRTKVATKVVTLSGRSGQP